MLKEREAEEYSDSDAVKKDKQAIAKKRKNPILCGGCEVKSLIPISSKKKKIVESSDSGEEIVTAKSTNHQVDLNTLITGMHELVIISKHS